jgi:hypothetical protein
MQIRRYPGFIAVFNVLRKLIAQFGDHPVATHISLPAY